MTRQSDTCPVSGSEVLETIALVKDVPIQCNRLWDDQVTAKAAPRGDIELAFCPESGHAFNRRFDPGKMRYQEDYENSLFHSPLFRSYAEQLADDLVQRHSLDGARALEIGCGDGGFLRCLLAQGLGSAVGLDPSCPTSETEDGRLRIIGETYGPAHAGR